MADLDSDLEQHLRHLQLPVVTRTNKEESIGVGSYASVYEVMVHGTLCAAKEMHPVLVNDTNKRAFLSECVQSSRILHPNVVQFLGIYYPSPRARLPWLVMELMYINLRGLIEKYEKDDFPFHFKLSILMDTCHGLQFLHSQNIIHRDLSSNNILLTKHLVAKISDLGMAKKHTWAPGTVVFMPPEAFSLNPQYGKPIDVFSVGCVCVHVTSMEWPIPLNQVVNNVILSEVQRRERYFTKMIPSLEQLVKQCLQDKPEQRPIIEEVIRGLKNINYDHQPHEDDNIIDIFTSALKRSSQDKQMEIVQKDQQLMSKDKQLVEKDEQLSKKDQQISQKDQKLSQKDQLIYQKDQLLFQKDQQKDQMLHRKDQEILEKEQRLYQKDQIIVQKDQQLVQKDQVIYEKDQRIKQKDQEIMEKEKQISQSKSLNKVTAYTTADDFSKVTVQEEYTVEFPSSWEVMPKDSSGKEIVCHVVDLQPSDPEYKEVYTAFTSTSKGIVFGRKMTVERIQRIQNPTLYGQYVHRKEIMYRQNPNIQIEKWLFHECSHSNFVKKIYHQGFNRSIAGPNSSSFGGGVGFAVRANQADTASSPAYRDYYSSDGSKFMFYVRVLTGDCTEVSKTYNNKLLKAPPTKDPNKRTSYDSVVDSVSFPKQYAVFNNDQSYPDYLIFYVDHGQVFYMN